MGVGSTERSPPFEDSGRATLAAAVLLAVAAIGLLRLAFAGRALRRLARTSRPIDATSVQELVANVCRKMFGEPRASARGNSELRPAYASRSPFGSPVTVKESDDLQTAATFGWRRPLILLPAAWRQWPREELVVFDSARGIRRLLDLGGMPLQMVGPLLRETSHGIARTT